MARHIFFEDNHAEVKLTGINRVLALKGSIRLPYTSIKRVRVEDFNPHAFMLRMPGTSLPPYLYEGSYKYQGNWLFLSMNNASPKLVIDTEGEHYDRIVLQLEHPSRTAAELRRHINEAAD